MRQESKTQDKKDFFKLMNNSAFGKMMENVRNRVDIRLKTSAEQYERMLRLTNYKSTTIFSENLAAVHMLKTEVKMDKPIYLGAAILDLSKVLMYGFWYDYVKPTWGENARLIMTDTDSLLMEIETEDFYEDIRNRGDHMEYFD